MDRWRQDLKVVGERIRKRRKTMGFSQEKFAYAAGLDRSYMGAIERGERNITFGTMSVISVSLKCGMADLLDGLPSCRDGEPPR